MNHHKFSQQLISAGLILFFLVGCSASATRGKIEGTVTLDGDVSKPIANVKVILDSDPFSPDGLKEIATTTTDAQGKYSFEDVKPGKYVVGASVQGQCMVLDIASTVAVEVGSVVKKDLSLPCTP